jgi:hypothetical protein
MPEGSPKKGLISMLDTNDRILFPASTEAIAPAPVTATMEPEGFDCEMCGGVFDESLMRQDGWGNPICPECFAQIMMEVEEVDSFIPEENAPDPMIVQESYSIEYDTDLTDDANDFRDSDISLSAEW